MSGVITAVNDSTSEKLYQAALRQQGRGGPRCRPE